MNPDDQELRSRVEELLGCLQQGREARVQLVEIVNEYRSYLLKIGNEDAQGRSLAAPSDIYQDVWIVVQGHLDSFRGTTEAEFRSWLRTIYVNQLRGAHRDDLREDNALAGAPTPDPSPSPSAELRRREEEAERAAAAAALERGLDRLSEVERAVFLLRERHKFEYQEIAAVFGREVHQVRYTYHQACLNLRRALS